VDPITRALEDIRAACAPAAATGVLADYIPQLKRADPAKFGLALASLDGDVYAAGDADQASTIQSVSKPFVYALALEELGFDAVEQRVGTEPSGEPFNAISLEPGTGRPANPLVNAGAILTTSLIATGFDGIHACLEAFAGHPLQVDEAVFSSERDTGDRNRAIAHLMRAAGSLAAPVDETIDAYFRQCSLLVSARDLAVMAATLAHGGRNPLTEQQVVKEETARHVLSVMAMCGMYDAAGSWMVKVGLPAKSGVSGGLLAVSPGQFGIGLFSPPLDARGNTVAGVQACALLSTRLGLHLLHDPAAEARSAKVQTTVPAPRSKRRRPRAERVLPQTVGLVALRGDMDFAAAELALRTTQALDVDWLVLDLRAITRLHTVAEALLKALPDQVEATVAVIAEHAFPTQDAALEWCEEQVLGERRPVALADHDLLAELDEDARAAVLSLATRRRLAPGDPGLGENDTLLAIISGRVDDVGDGGIVSRLDGEGTRARQETSAFALTRDAMAALEREHPEALIGLWRALAAWMSPTPALEEAL